MAAQHREYFTSIGDSCNPRAAFLKDIGIIIAEATCQGDQVIVLLNRNSNMKSSDLSRAFSGMNLSEVILKKHGLLGPCTCKGSPDHSPIDGIWSTLGIQMLAGGYFDYDKVFPNMDHMCLWLDLSFVNAFGHNMPSIVRPHIWRLHCKDPRIMNNYCSHLREFMAHHKLKERVESLLASTSYPMPQHLIAEYNRLDNLQCKGVALSKRKGRKLRTSQVAFSSTLQLAGASIHAWNLLLKRCQGGKVSYRHLD